MVEIRCLRRESLLSVKREIGQQVTDEYFVFFFFSSLKTSTFDIKNTKLINK